MMTSMRRVLLGLALAAPAIGSERSAAAMAPNQMVSEPAVIVLGSEAARVAEWIDASEDNHSLPYAIVDKMNASLFLFDGRGRLLSRVPVLVGIAPGDEASPGVGSKKLAELGPNEKTTPAGRFLAKFGIPFRGQRVLWVDYSTSVALHPIPMDAASTEQRRARMLSPTPDYNRITFGCINVPKDFYSRVLRPQFQKRGGYVYVLPDIRPLEDVFPRLRVYALTHTGKGH